MYYDPTAFARIVASNFFSGEHLSRSQSKLDCQMNYDQLEVPKTEMWGRLGKRIVPGRSGSRLRPTSGCPLIIGIPIPERVLTYSKFQSWRKSKIRGYNAMVFDDDVSQREIQ